MPGEQAKDSRPPDPITRFRVEVYRSVIDQITSSLEERFVVNRAIILDTSCLDPRRFKELNDGGIPLGSLDKVAELAGLDATSLCSELSVFARRYKSQCSTLQKEFSIVPCENLKMNQTLPCTDVGLLFDVGEQSHHETDKTMEVDSRVVKCAEACKQCIACCYKVLHRYSLHASAFTNLYLAYQQ